MDSADSFNDNNYENNQKESNLTGREDDFQRPTNFSDDNNYVKNVYIHRNGDMFSSSRRFVYNKKQIRTWDIFLENLTSTMNPRTGPIRSIHTPQTGTRVHSFEDILPNRNYVALASGEKLQMIGYLKLLQEQEAAKKRRNYDIPSQSLPEVNNSHEHQSTGSSSTQRRLLVSGRIKYELQKRGKTIFIFRNGDEYTRAIYVLLKYFEHQSMDVVLKVIGEKVILPTSLPIRRLFNMNGDLILTPDQLEDNKFYVAAGNETFVPCLYGQTLPNIICGPNRKQERIHFLNSITTPDIGKQRSKNKNQNADLKTPKTSRNEKQQSNRTEKNVDREQKICNNINSDGDLNTARTEEDGNTFQETDEGRIKEREDFPIPDDNRREIYSEEVLFN